MTSYPSENIFNSQEWVNAITRAWNCEARHLVFGTERAGLVEATVYFKNGKIFNPPLLYYDRMRFISSNTEAPYKVQAQWHELTMDFCDEAIKLGLREWRPAPHIQDVRPFLWKGFSARPAYTYWVNLQPEIPRFAHAVRKQIAKGVRSGYICKRDQNTEALISCLRDTENRKTRQIVPPEFSSEHLSAFIDSFGKDRCRIYSCYTVEGAAVSSRVILLDQQGFAFDWLAGTKHSHLNQGVTQFLIDMIFTDLQTLGCQALDFGGANVESIQRYKADFGGDLITYFIIEKNDLKAELSKLLNALRNTKTYMFLRRLFR